MQMYWNLGKDAPKIPRNESRERQNWIKLQRIEEIQNNFISNMWVGLGLAAITIYVTAKEKLYC